MLHGSQRLPLGYVRHLSSTFNTRARCERGRWMERIDRAADVAAEAASQTDALINGVATHLVSIDDDRTAI